MTRDTGAAARPIIVLGSINRDLVMSVDRLPATGETVTGGSLSRHWGGKGANQAVAAARWGADVQLVAAVGDDPTGRDALAELTREGVAVDHVTVQPGLPTGTAFVLVDRAGANQIAVASGANTATVSDALDDVAGPVVLLGCFEVPVAAVAAAVELGRDRGWTIVINPAPALPLPDAFRDSGVLLTPNLEELAALTGQSNFERAVAQLRDFTRGPIVVTLGADGVLLQTDGETRTITAPRVSVADTTGAGDTFNGVLAAALARGAALADAVEEGVRAASASVQVEGARAGMPRKGEHDG